MKATIYASDFNKLIATAKPFVSKWNNITSREIHRWIRLEFSKESQKIKAIALDSYKVSVETLTCLNVDGDFICYIHQNIKKFDTKSILTIELKDEKLIIDDGFSIAGYWQPRTDNAKGAQNGFFDYKKFINDNEKKETVFKIAINPQMLMMVMKSIVASKEDDANRGIVLEFKGELDPVVIKNGNNNENYKFILPMRVR